MGISLSSFFLYLVFSNIVIANIAFESNIHNLQDFNREKVTKVKSHVNFHILLKGYVPPSAPSKRCHSHSPKGYVTLPESLKVFHLNCINLHKSRVNFPIIPKGYVPPSGPSDRFYSCFENLHSRHPPQKPNNLVNAPPHTYFHLPERLVRPLIN